MSIAQQACNTPAWMMSTLLVGFVLQGVWVLYRAFDTSRRRGEDQRIKAEHRARVTEDGLVLAEVRAVRERLESISDRLKIGAAKFDRLDDRVSGVDRRVVVVERDVRDLKSRGGTGS